jgi:hypothetical protein
LERFCARFEAIIRQLGGPLAAAVPRFGEVTPRQPKTGADPRDPAQIPLRLIEVREVEPPGGATAVCWRLYTTHPVDTLDQAPPMVERHRWLLEHVGMTRNQRNYTKSSKV